MHDHRTYLPCHRTVHVANSSRVGCGAFGVNAEDYLRRLLAVGCDEYHCNGYESNASCFYCEGEAGFVDEVKNQHKPSCPYADAKRFLDQQDASRKALKELADDLQDFRPATWG